MNIFELGISGEFGKVYSADPETLIGWVQEYQKKSNNKKSYYESGLAHPSLTILSDGYPSGLDDWHKEVNKAFTKWLGGTGCDNFHPHIYDRLMIDNKIKMNSYKKYFNGTTNVDTAKQLCISDFFLIAKQYGLTQIYNVK